MTEEQIALGRRAVACKGWRWMPGMLVVDAIGKQRIYDDVAGEPYWSTDGWLPDLTDPATLGCLLALVREWHTEVGLVPIDMGHGEWQVLFRGGHVVGTSEAEALIAALEAAP